MKGSRILAGFREQTSKQTLVLNRVSLQNVFCIRQGNLHTKSTNDTRK